MAIARPVRALGFAAVFMWCFFIWQIFKPTGRPVMPSRSGITNFERDPNLDREDTVQPAFGATR
jgi:mannosyltransferase